MADGALLRPGPAASTPLGHAAPRVNTMLCDHATDAIPQARLLTAPALAEHLRAGGAALLPTDTLPALAVQPEQAGQIWLRKQRPADKPLILMGADLAQLLEVLSLPWQEAWLQQAERHWPGAVTLVLPLEGPLTQHLHPGGTTLGLRVPACPLLQDLLRRSGPLATSSANRSGLPAARDASEAASQFADLPLLAPLPWPVASGQASAVWQWQGEAHPEGPWRVLRPGAVHPERRTAPAASPSRPGGA
jgi:L-threonylcarbamoyladenylate synthase